MKFMATWSISQDQRLPVLKKFRAMSPEEQKDVGSEATIIGRRHDVVGRRGFVIFEANGVVPVQRYLGQWNPYCDIEIVPVVEDDEATAICRRSLQEPALRGSAAGR